MCKFLVILLHGCCFRDPKNMGNGASLSDFPFTFKAAPTLLRLPKIAAPQQSSAEFQFSAIHRERHKTDLVLKNGLSPLKS